MKNKKDINPQEVFDKLSEDIAAMREGVQTGNFSKKEIAKFREDLQDVILEAYQLKFSVRLDILADEQPNLSMKDILVLMLDLLPSDINPAFLPVLTQYVFENWKVVPQKLAA